MPALPDVPGVCRIVLRQTLGEDADLVNRFYVKYGGTPGTLASTDANNVASGVASAWNSHMAPSMSTSLTLHEVNVEDLTSDTGAVGLWTGSHAGTSTGTDLPAEVCVIIKQVIERRYRGGHPRQYLGGILSGALSDPQTFTSAFQTAILSAYTAFRGAISATFPVGLQPTSDVSVSFYHGFTNVTYPSGRIRPRNTVRSTAVVDQIASFATNPKVGSQRRRSLQSA